MKKIYGFLVISISAMAVLFGTLSIKAEAANVTSGTLGDNDKITWTYDADTKTMTLVGDGTLEIVNWGKEPIGDICPDVKKIIVKDCKLSNCDGMFWELGKLQSIEFDNFDTSQVTGMYGMFYSCRNLNSVDVSGFDTSKVTNMGVMFCACDDLSSVDVSGFDTSKVTNMSSMFSGCDNLSSVDVSGFDTSQVTDMSDMFAECGKLSSVDVSGFDTSQVTRMGLMFEGCRSLESVDVSRFETQNLRSVGCMFFNCEKLTELDLSSFNLKNIDTEGGNFTYLNMLKGCEALVTINTPAALKNGIEIELPDTFVDEKGNTTTKITEEFCNKKLVKDKSAKVRAFVSRMYTVALGRAAEADGLDFYTQRLIAGDSNGACLAESFLCSPEFLNKGYDDAQYVTVLYKTFFDREPAAEEVNYWVGKIADGQTRAFVLSGFVNSVEFDNLCISYGISRGFMREDGKPLNPGIGRFAERLYTVVLERAGEKEGIEYWSLNIANGVCTPKDAAKSFFFSQEYVNKNTTDAKYITTLYKTFMDREPEEGGVEYWQNVLNNGATREQILEGFADSAEFKGIMANFGL